MKLEKLDSKKFQTLENTQLPKVMGGAVLTKIKTKLLGITKIDGVKDL